MTLFRSPTSRSSDAQIDQSLRSLFESTAVPSPRTGFDRRLARAVAQDRESERQSRTVRRVLRLYWAGAAIVSVAILWQLQERLVSGPGLWLTVGGLVILALAGLSFSILAALPVKLERFIRLLSVR